MWAPGQVGWFQQKLTQRVGTILALALAATLPLAAQMHGPPATTTIGGHSLAPPPSVTSIGGRHLPPPTPSVTSIPNIGLQRHRGFYSNGYYRGRGYLRGWAYSYPYYYPLDNPAAYGYDYVGSDNPDLYSGPPLGPDQNPHMVIEQPPSRPYYGGDYPPYQQAYAPPPPAPQQQAALPSPPPAEVNPGEPTVLVFRDGHQQEVSNYAIMGDTVYVFDKGRKKIALAELDVPATTKANDDRGLEFKLPPSPAKKKSPTVPQSATPDQNNTAPASVASAIP